MAIITQAALRIQDEVTHSDSTLAYIYFRQFLTFCQVSQGRSLVIDSEHYTW